MIVGLILVGSVVGAMSGLTTLILGHSVWMALLIYSCVGVLSVLAGATLLAFRVGVEDRPDASGPQALVPPQRG